MCHVSKAIFCLALFMVLAENIDYGGNCFPLVFLSFNSCASVRDLVLSSHSRPLWFLKSVKSFSTSPLPRCGPWVFWCCLSVARWQQKGCLCLDVYCFILEHTSLPQKWDRHKSSPVSEGGWQKERKTHLWLEKSCPHPSKAGGMCQESLLRIEESVCLWLSTVAVRGSCRSSCRNSPTPHSPQEFFSSN